MHIHGQRGNATHVERGFLLRMISFLIFCVGMNCNNIIFYKKKRKTEIGLMQAISHGTNLSQKSYF